VQQDVFHINTIACNTNNFYFNVTGEGAEPHLGDYGNPSVVAGSITTLSQQGGVAFSTIQAVPPTDFEGVLSVDPVSGEVHVINPTQTGMFKVKLFGFGEPGEESTFDPDVFLQTEESISMLDTISFILEVLPQLCSDGLFDLENIAIDSVGDAPSEIKFGDFNNDGIHDFIATHEPDQVLDFNPLELPNANGASLRYGVGDGTFTKQGQNQELVVGYDPEALAIADLNGDGIQDIAVANSDPVGNVFLRPGIEADLGFELPDILNGGVILLEEQIRADYLDPYAHYPQSVKVGDFNSDGKQDLAIVNEGAPIIGTNSIVSIYVGDGLLGFESSESDTIVVESNREVGRGSASLVMGDFNEDGLHDFATASKYENKISVRLGNGRGFFSTAADVNIGSSPSFIALGDFNQDSHQDLVTTNKGDNNISIILGNGNGTFQTSPKIEYETGEAPSHVTVADFNGNGIQDLAVANYDDATVYIYLGEGDGHFFYAPGAAHWRWPEIHCCSRS
jgi:hypothetical protein